MHGHNYYYKRSAASWPERYSGLSLQGIDHLSLKFHCTAKLYIAVQHGMPHSTREYPSYSGNINDEVGVGGG